MQGIGLTNVFRAIREGLSETVTIEPSTEGSEVYIMQIPWVRAIYERYMKEQIMNF